MGSEIKYLGGFTVSESKIRIEEKKLDLEKEKEILTLKTFSPWTAGPGCKAPGFDLVFIGNDVEEKLRDFEYHMYLDPLSGDIKISKNRRSERHFLLCRTDD